MYCWWINTWVWKQELQDTSVRRVGIHTHVINVCPSLGWFTLLFDNLGWGLEFCRPVCDTREPIHGLFTRILAGGGRRQGGRIQEEGS